MRHLIRRHALVVLAFVLGISSVSVMGIAPAAGQSQQPVRTEFALGVVTGFTYVDASQRIVVAGDDEVLIFDLQGNVVHRVVGIAGASDAEAWGSSVVVIASETDELVVVDTISGQVTRRFAAGVGEVSSVAVAGDTAWFAHGPDQWDAGIASLNLVSGARVAARIDPYNIYTGAAIVVPENDSSMVFGTHPSSSPSRLFAYDDSEPSFRNSPYHEPLSPQAVSREGDRLWVVNDRSLVEISTTSLTKTGMVYQNERSVYPVSAEHIAVSDDRWLVVSNERTVQLFDVGNPQPINAVFFADGVAAVDVSADRLFVVDGAANLYNGFENSGEKSLWILPHDYLPVRNTISIGIDAHGTPGRWRPGLHYTCSDGSTGNVAQMPYGYWTDLDVPAGVTWCSVTLSPVEEPHRTYVWTSGGELVESKTARVAVTGDRSQDVAEFFQVLPSPINDATEFVEQQYDDLLQRNPDQAGVAYWVNQLNSGALVDYQLVQRFVESPEFLGSMAPAMRLYLAYFLRWPDAEGLAFWANAIRSGMAVGQISDFFATSPEFMQRYGAVSNRDFVTLVYANVLGRSPDAAGYNYWLTRMNGGMSRGAVMASFSESPEFISQTRAQVAVRALYRGLLRRDPDAGGFDFWANQYRQTQSLAPLIVGFLDSDEYFDRFWFWDEAGLPPTRVGGLQRDHGPSSQSTRCPAQCADGRASADLQEVARRP